jgi:hypothetical protein
MIVISEQISLFNQLIDKQRTSNCRKYREDLNPIYSESIGIFI